jgi:kynurenine formamidase
MREIEFTTDGRRWRADLAAPADLAIPLQFDRAQPSFFATEPARAAPLRAGRFTGDVRQGASCNCGVYSLAPHCHGTHTECAAHVTIGGEPIAALTPASPSLAVLLTVRPVALGATSDAAAAHGSPSDPVITRKLLTAAAAPWLADPWMALVLRTLPNDPSKLQRIYAGACPAPYFLPDAMEWIVDRGVTSLVVDLPSLDRAEDGGALAAHRIYWGLPAGERDPQLAERGRALVTELAYIPPWVPDGLHLLDLHVPAFGADAAPSRPVLYPVHEIAA